MESIIMIIILIALLYFMMIRPESKRKKEMDNMRESLKVGDEITTIGGVLGTICAVKEKSIVVETGQDRVRLEMAKWAVSTKGLQTSEEGSTRKEKKKEKQKELVEENEKALKEDEKAMKKEIAEKAGKKEETK